MTPTCGLKRNLITFLLGSTFAFLLFRLFLVDARNLSQFFSLFDIIGGDEKANDSDYRHLPVSVAQSSLWSQRLVLNSHIFSRENTKSSTLNLSILGPKSTKTSSLHSKQSVDHVPRQMQRSRLVRPMTPDSMSRPVDTTCLDRCRWPYEGDVSKRLPSVEWPTGPMTEILTADTFRDIADFVYPWTSPHRKPSMCGFISCGGEIRMPDFKDVSICLPALPILFAHANNAAETSRLARDVLKRPFIFISHDSDLMAPGDITGVVPNPYLVKWYANGVTDFMSAGRGERLVEPIPYGMNAFFNGGALAMYLRDRMQMKAWEPKTRFDEGRLDQGQPFVLFNCAIESNPTVRARIREHFCSNKTAFPAVHCHTSKRHLLGNKTAWFDFYDEISNKYKFWISPPGNCAGRKYCGAGHRVFEAISLGMVPIWQEDPFTDGVLPPDTPIIRVTDWSHITNNWLVKMARVNYSNHALLFEWPERRTMNPSYWQRKILDFREQRLRKEGAQREQVLPRSRCWGRESALVSSS